MTSKNKISNGIEMIEYCGTFEEISAAILALENPLILNTYFDGTCYTVLLLNR